MTQQEQLTVWAINISHLLQRADEIRQANGLPTWADTVSRQHGNPERFKRPIFGWGYYYAGW